MQAVKDIISTIVDPKVLNTVKWTSQLDPIFRSNYDQQPTLLWQYIGSPSGALTSYPGKIQYFQIPTSYQNVIPVKQSLALFTVRRPQSNHVSTTFSEFERTFDQSGPEIETIASTDR